PCPSSPRAGRPARARSSPELGRRPRAHPTHALAYARRMPLDDDPFDYEVTKQGLLRIFRGGREVTRLGGPAAERVLARLGASADSDQQVLARATGNYKRGNERTPGRP